MKKDDVIQIVGKDFYESFLLPSGSSLLPDKRIVEEVELKTCSYCGRISDADLLYCEDGCGALLPKYNLHKKKLERPRPKLSEIARKSLGI